MSYFVFEKARPVWAADREREMNCELAFRAELPGGRETAIDIATSGVYRLFINGKFVAAGPARVAHGFFSVDRLELTEHLDRVTNILVLEVVGYNINSYDIPNQPSFLTAELRQGGEVVTYTWGGAFPAYDLGRRIQKVQRYSFQRPFAEAYRLSGDIGAYQQPGWEQEEVPLAVQEEKRTFLRQVRMPRFEVLPASALIGAGKAGFDAVCPNPVRHVSYTDVGDTIKGFLPSELEVRLSDEAQDITCVPGEWKSQPPAPLPLENGYGLYEFPYNATGFLRLEAQCEAPCTLYVLFDEILTDGDVDFLRMTSCNCFRYQMEAGEHTVMTFAPYTMKYCKLVVKGACQLQNLEIVEYKHPPVPYRVNLPHDAVLKSIYEAALESFRANAVDVFTDCPSRERAGWLCDSFFTARVEYALTGESVLERAFLQNFLLAERFPHLPEGMLPMCYPADHDNGNFIPNWAMWFVLEMEEYKRRSGDDALIERARERVYALLQYFETFENEHGLLESLEKWVFLEWSRANDPDVVQDVNFPTNMLYARMLRAVSALYGDPQPAEKAERIRRVIRARSFDGRFYTDNERRAAEGLVNPGNHTEVCQYYAFFTGIATKEEDKKLWDTLVEDFGPQRKTDNRHPDVAFANAFIGNYLRIELLYEDGRYGDVVENIRGYFASMARQTGTLWEFDRPEASCNHGFASHVIYWLAGIYGLEPGK